MSPLCRIPKAGATDFLGGQVRVTVLGPAWRGEERNPDDTADSSSYTESSWSGESVTHPLLEQPGPMSAANVIASQVSFMIS